jgi:hypothetical protein
MDGEFFTIHYFNKKIDYTEGMPASPPEGAEYIESRGWSGDKLYARQGKWQTAEGRIVDQSSLDADAQQLYSWLADNPGPQDIVSVLVAMNWLRTEEPREDDFLRLHMVAVHAQRLGVHRGGFTSCDFWLLQHENEHPELYDYFKE